MADKRKPRTEESTVAMSVSTDNVPTLYANVASIVMGPLDVRIYLIEGTPAEVSVTTPLSQMKSNFAPRLCVVGSPEFARSLRDALTQTLEKFEVRHGKLRPSRQVVPPSLPEPETKQ